MHESYAFPIVIAFIIAMTIILESCRATAPCVPETIARDSIRTQHILDSIYLYERDSIFVRTAADTVWIERWKTRYKDVVRIQHDTIIDTRKETQVQQVRYIPTFHKVCAWIVCIAVAVLVLWLIVWIAVRCRRI